MKRTYLALLAVPVAVALAACGSSGSSAESGGATGNGGSSASQPGQTGGAEQPATTGSAGAGSSATSTALPTAPGAVTIGSADFPESTLLADIYGDAMAANGVKVSKHPNIGERGIYMAALQDGSIGAIPEYSGSILSYLDKKATAKAPDEVYAALKVEAAKEDLVPTQYAAAQDADTITVTKKTAAKYHLKTIADLKPVAGDLTFGAPAQFRTRADGLPALKKIYGVVFGRFTPLSASGSATVTALKNGTIDAGDIFSTDPAIAKNGFVSLQDPKNMFAAQNVVPLFRKDVLTQPMVEACNAVSAKLDTATLAKLVAQVASGKSPETVARAWLTSAGLI